MADKDVIILNFGDSLIKNSDLCLLTSPNWINDKIIGFCFEYFEKEQFNRSADRIALISPSVAQFTRFASVEDLLLVLEPLRLPSKQYVFIPINDNQDTERIGGSHWSLLVYVRSKQEFQHFDSSSSMNGQLAKKFMDKLQPFVQAPKSKLKFIEMECPQQENSHDCGVYVIAIAEHLIKEFCECFSVGLKETVNRESVQLKRTLIRDIILNLSAADIDVNNRH